MKWNLLRRSENVEDRRGIRTPLIVGGGLGGILIAIVITLLGGDPSVILQGNNPNAQAPSSGKSRTSNGAPQNSAENTLADFSSHILGSTEDVWTAEFKQRGETYTRPHLVLFTDAVQSACGRAGAAVGPFYCPLDQRLYIDLSFYQLLKSRLGAPGDFAQAYVVAHEIGHHLQNLTGALQRADQLKARLQNQADANKVQVLVELQADCYAGVWAERVKKQGNILDEGDLEEALVAASRIGDDVLQQEARGRVVPNSFTHGSAQQRRMWLEKGMREGELASCDTFKNNTQFAEIRNQKF